MAHKGKPKSEYQKVQYSTKEFADKWMIFMLWAAKNCVRKAEFSEDHALFLYKEDSEKFERWLNSEIR